MFIRVLSAIVGVSLLYASWFFFAINGLLVICSLASLIGCTEYAAMTESKSLKARLVFILLSFAFHLTFVCGYQGFEVFSMFFLALVTSSVFFNRKASSNPLPTLCFKTVGLLYCGGLTGLVIMGLGAFELAFFIPLLLISFTTDTFAYLGGRLLGKTPLAPAISPNKTVEGGLIGLVGGASAGFLYLSTTDHSSSILALAATCVFASALSQIGDLFESLIKRTSGVKDSGKILPGHGGVLDRIDGVLFTAPLLYIWLDTFLN